MRCADLGPMLGRWPSSSIRSWTTPSYMAESPTRLSRTDCRGCPGRASRRRPAGPSCPRPACPPPRARRAPRRSPGRPASRCPRGSAASGLMSRPTRSPVPVTLAVTRPPPALPETIVLSSSCCASTIAAASAWPGRACPAGPCRRSPASRHRVRSHRGKPLCVLLFLPLLTPLCEVVLDHTRSETEAANTACPGRERPGSGRVRGGRLGGDLGLIRSVEAGARTAQLHRSMFPPAPAPPHRAAQRAPLSPRRPTAARRVPGRRVRGLRRCPRRAPRRRRRRTSSSGRTAGTGGGGGDAGGAGDGSRRLLRLGALSLVRG